MPVNTAFMKASYIYVSVRRFSRKARTSELPREAARNTRKGEIFSLPKRLIFMSHHGMSETWNLKQ